MLLVLNVFFLFLLLLIVWIRVSFREFHVFLVLYTSTRLHYFFPNQVARFNIRWKCECFCFKERFFGEFQNNREGSLIELPLNRLVVGFFDEHELYFFLQVAESRLPDRNRRNPKQENEQASECHDVNSCLEVRRIRVFPFNREIVYTNDQPDHEDDHEFLNRQRELQSLRLRIDDALRWMLHTPNASSNRWLHTILQRSQQLLVKV